MTKDVLIQLNNLCRKGNVTNRIIWIVSSVSPRLVMAIMQCSRLAAAAYYPPVSPGIEIYVTSLTVCIGIDLAAGRIVIGGRRTGLVGYRSGPVLMEQVAAKHHVIIGGIVKKS